MPRGLGCGDPHLEPVSHHPQCQCPVRQRLDGRNIPAEGAVAVHGFRQPTQNREERGIGDHIPGLQRGPAGALAPDYGKVDIDDPLSRQGTGGQDYALDIYPEGVTAGVEPSPAAAALRRRCRCDQEDARGHAPLLTHGSSSSLPARESRSTAKMWSPARNPLAERMSAPERVLSPRTSRAASGKLLDL